MRLPSPDLRHLRSDAAVPSLVLGLVALSALAVFLQWWDPGERWPPGTAFMYLCRFHVGPALIGLAGALLWFGAPPIGRWSLRRTAWAAGWVVFVLIVARPWPEWLRWHSNAGDALLLALALLPAFVYVAAHAGSAAGGGARGRHRLGVAGLVIWSSAAWSEALCPQGMTCCDGELPFGVTAIGVAETLAVQGRVAIVALLVLLGSCWGSRVGRDPVWAWLAALVAALAAARSFLRAAAYESMVQGFVWPERLSALACWDWAVLALAWAAAIWLIGATVLRARGLGRGAGGGLAGVLACVALASSLLAPVDHGSCMVRLWPIWRQIPGMRPLSFAANARRRQAFIRDISVGYAETYALHDGVLYALDPDGDRAPHWRPTVVVDERATVGELRRVMRWVGERYRMRETARILGAGREDVRVDLALLTRDIDDFAFPMTRWRGPGKYGRAAGGVTFWGAVSSPFECALREPWSDELPLRVALNAFPAPSRPCHSFVEPAGPSSPELEVRPVPQHFEPARPWRNFDAELAGLGLGLLLLLLGLRKDLRLLRAVRRRRKLRAAGLAAGPPGRLAALEPATEADRHLRLVPAWLPEHLATLVVVQPLGVGPFRAGRSLRLGRTAALGWPLARGLLAHLMRRLVRPRFLAALAFMLLLALACWHHAPGIW